MFYYIIKIFQIILIFNNSIKRFDLTTSYNIIYIYNIIFLYI